MTTKQPRTKRIQVRCQPCHYDQILKVAKIERDRLEESKDEVAYTEMRQAGSRAKLRYVAFFDKMKDLLTDKDLTNIVTESELIREIMVKQIEKLIIEKGV